MLLVKKVLSSIILGQLVVLMPYNSNALSMSTDRVNLEMQDFALSFYFHLIAPIQIKILILFFLFQIPNIISPKGQCPSFLLKVKIWMICIQKQVQCLI